MPPLKPTSVDALNRRFRRSPYAVDAVAATDGGDGGGGSLWPASGALADSGVLVHVFDGFEQHGGLKWLPVEGAKHMSASLIYAGQRANPMHRIPVFNQVTSGLVLRPRYHLVECGCDSDCGGRCVGAFGRTTSDGHMPSPGANPPPSRSGGTISSDPASPLWCDPKTARAGEWHGGCVWRPGPSIGHMLSLNAGSDRYNEIIVSAEFWRAHMPAAVEAVLGNSEVHAAFVKAYGLRSEEVPLVELDLGDFEAPFRAKT